MLEESRVFWMSCMEQELVMMEGLRRFEDEFDA